jgi:hypothetical protein
MGMHSSSSWQRISRLRLEEVLGRETSPRWELLSRLAPRQDLEDAVCKICYIHVIEWHKEDKSNSGWKPLNGTLSNSTERYW